MNNSPYTHKVENPPCFLGKAVNLCKNNFLGGFVSFWWKEDGTHPFFESLPDVFHILVDKIFVGQIAVSWKKVSFRIKIKFDLNSNQ